MTAADFIEKLLGIQMMPYQKEMVNFYANLPEGAQVVMGRKGPIVLDKDGKRLEIKR